MSRKRRDRRQQYAVLRPNAGMQSLKSQSLTPLTFEMAIAVSATGSEDIVLAYSSLILAELCATNEQSLHKTNLLHSNKNIVIRSNGSVQEDISHNLTELIFEMDSKTRPIY